MISSYRLLKSEIFWEVSFLLEASPKFSFGENIAHSYFLYLEINQSYLSVWKAETYIPILQINKPSSEKAGGA